MAFVEICDVSKSYCSSFRKTQAVDHVTQYIEQGDFVAVKGKSGSGKSTLLKLIAGILRADSGTITVHGKQITALKENELLAYRRRDIGIVFQSFELLPYHNVLENILLPLHLNHQNIDVKQIDQLLEELHIQDLKNSFPDELSGGEKQRVAIARAIIHQPKIILLDEPTGNLDSENTILFMELLKHIHEQLNTTILMVTHDEEAASYANRIITMKDGRLI